MALELLRVDLDLVRERSRRVIRISVDSKEGRLLSAEGSGTGNPFEFGQFSGEAHGNVTGLGVVLSVAVTEAAGNGFSARLISGFRWSKAYLMRW